jgi:hypothetical protein
MDKGVDPYAPAKLGDLLQVAELLGAELQKIHDKLARPTLSFAGTWREGKHYLADDLVQFQGGLWLCVAPTEGARPHASPHWRLIVKKGSLKEEAAK